MFFVPKTFFAVGSRYLPSKRGGLIYNIYLASLKADLQGRVVQNLIKLFHGKQEFGLSFLTFHLGFLCI